MNPSERSNVLSSLSDDLSEVKDLGAKTDGDDVAEQLEQCREDYEKCSAYVADLFARLDKGILFSGIHLLHCTFHSLHFSFLELSYGKKHPRLLE